MVPPPCEAGPAQDGPDRCLGRSDVRGAAGPGRHGRAGHIKERQRPSPTSRPSRSTCTHRRRSRDLPGHLVGLGEDIRYALDDCPDQTTCAPSSSSTRSRTQLADGGSLHWGDLARRPQSQVHLKRSRPAPPAARDHPVPRRFPLQHPQVPLVPRLAVIEHLRETAHGCPPGSRVTEDTRVQGMGASPTAVTGAQPSSGVGGAYAHHDDEHDRLTAPDVRR